MSDGFFLKKGNIPYLVCGGITFTHGFSTREGGVSRGNGLDTLDLGMGNENDVYENRRRFALALSSDISSMFSAKQIHSTKVVTVTSSDIGKRFECDGFVTKEKGLLLTVKVADCVPILLSDEKNGVIAAVHAGWRGTVNGIASEAVRAMTELGAEVRHIKAAIGPCIHPCCYEVDIPFVNAVKEARYGKELLPFIVPSDKDDKLFADLPSMNLQLLTLCGLSEKNITISSQCTCCESNVFFSHRASGGKRGLMMAGIVMN